jgi:hypothetical protein
VLILMMIRMTEEAHAVSSDLLQSHLSNGLVSEIQQWFSAVTRKRTTAQAVSAAVEAGAGVRGGSLLNSLFGLFASAKGEIKYASDRSSEAIDTELRRLPELVSLCNRLINACETVLQKAENKKWLLIIEDLDKTVIPPQQLQDLFVQYGTVFQDLAVSLIFTIPVWLGYSPDRNRLPFDYHMIHDTPVFEKDHAPHHRGRDALRQVLEARMSPDLFAENQMTKLIVASGGNIRELFRLVSDAGDRAVLKDSDAKSIGEDECIAAIQANRRDYRRILGQSPYDSQSISYEEKLKKLLAVYSGDQDAQIPDLILYSLLRARAIQEFNGEGWFGLHPVVVDILKEQGHLPSESPGGTE